MYYVSRPATCWLHGLLASSRSMFRYPMIMGSIKCCRASYRSGRYSNVKGGRYKPRSGVQVSLLTHLQLTKFGLW